MSDRCIVDACALIALLNEEQGADVVERVFKEALFGGVSLVMNKLNFLEVYYGLFREYDKETADDLFDTVKELPIRIQSELTDDVTREAGRLKASYKVSIADSVALAEASVAGYPLLTSDHHEFDVIEESENIKFHWIR